MSVADSKHNMHTLTQWWCWCVWACVCMRARSFSPFLSSSLGLCLIQKYIHLGMKCVWNKWWSEKTTSMIRSNPNESVSYTRHNENSTHGEIFMNGKSFCCCCCCWNVSMNRIRWIRWKFSHIISTLLRSMCEYPPKSTYTRTQTRVHTYYMIIQVINITHKRDYNVYKIQLLQLINSIRLINANGIKLIFFFSVVHFNWYSTPNFNFLPIKVMKSVKISFVPKITKISKISIHKCRFLYETWDTARFLHIKSHVQRTNNKKLLNSNLKQINRCAWCLNWNYSKIFGALPYLSFNKITEKGKRFIDM